MSSTRRVNDGQRRKQNGWASATEFDELRGLNGTAVALKAELFDDAKTKELLYFLQGVSLLPGGVRRIASELIEMFPERIGSPTMIKIGCKPGKRLTQEERAAIDEELNHSDTTWAILRRDVDSDTRELCQTSAADFLNVCLGRAEKGLETFIERVCCDPSVALLNEGKERTRYQEIAQLVLQDCGQLDENKSLFVQDATLEYFHDLMGALHEYKRRYEQRRREDFIETSVGTAVFEALDYALETGRSALIEGNSGIGKTTGLDGWIGMHLGRARIVKLKGITHRTGFFREVARACGLARGTALSPGKIQMRVEQFLQRSKLMLVIDEGQYLFPPGNRVYTPPELINWLMTACYNEGVPFVISATSEFRKRRAIIEKNTTWQSEQLRRRIRRNFELPQKPTKEDLLLVSEKLLPGQSRSAIELVAGYSMASGGYFQAITDTIDDARLMARRDGRDKFTFADLRAAIQDWRSPSDNALQRVFTDPPKARRAGRSGSVETESTVQTEEPFNDRLKAGCEPIKAIPRQQLSLVPN